MSLQESEWEKEFDEKYAKREFHEQDGTEFYFEEAKIYPEIKDFIRRTILNRENEIADEVDKMKRVGKRNEEILDSQYKPTYEEAYEVGFVRGEEWMRLIVLSIFKD